MFFEMVSLGNASNSRVLQKIGVAIVMHAQKSGAIRNFLHSLVCPSCVPRVCEENVKCFSWNFTLLDATYPF